MSGTEAARPWWLTVLVWIAGSLMVLMPLSLVVVGVLWPGFFVQVACFLVLPMLIALFALGAILMKPMPPADSESVAAADRSGG
jgi:hypothetical protein